MFLNGAFMRTTLTIKEDLLIKVKELSGAKTKKEAVEKALEEYVRKRKVKEIMKLEGKIDLSITLNDLLKRRKRDVPYR
tara:strand:- start:1059 stop:1295 length:237 start_codon:yes stop_codon:yes gene_type:complete